MVLTICFFLPMLLLAYHYLVFPWILAQMAKNHFKNNPDQKTTKIEQGQEPKVAILLAVYNEERVLVQKIESTFNTSYPLSKLELYIGSDASTDKTDQLIQEYQEKYPNIQFKKFGARTGKPQIINQLNKISDAEILILTDANVFFEKNTICNLVNHFADTQVGLVGGNILNLETKKDGISNQEKTYLSAENSIKYNEGLLFGKMMGAFGGIYALRKKVYSPVPAGFMVDDFYITMKVIEQGYKSINALDAVAYEDVSNIASEEFRRKVRIGTGNFQNLFHFKHLVWQGGSTAFCFVSHKVIRWKGSFLLLISWLSAGVLALESTFFVVLFIGFTLFLLTPLLDQILMKGKIHIKLLRFASHFVLMNLALMLGFMKFMSGNSQSTWTPTQRNQ